MNGINDDKWRFMEVLPFGKHQLLRGSSICLKWINGGLWRCNGSSLDFLVTSMDLTNKDEDMNGNCPPVIKHGFLEYPPFICFFPS
jgi:hypothetical protein